MKKLINLLMFCVISKLSLAQNSNKYLQNAQNELVNKNIEAAITSAQTAVRLDTLNDKAFSFLAKCFLITKEYNYSLLTINKAIALRPSEEYFLLKANIDNALSYHEEQVLDYIKALKLSENTSTRYLKGVKLVSLKRFDDAIVDFQINIKNQKDSDRDYFGLFKCFLFKKDTVSALISIEEGIKNCTDPSDVGTLSF